jgi:hypothetical protein
MKPRLLLLGGAPLVLLFAACAAKAQLTSNDPPPAMGSHTLPNPTPRPADEYRTYDNDPSRARALREAERLRNQMRQHLVISTTDELVQLTAQLRTDIRNDPHLLSPADERERLKQIQDLAKLIVSTMKAE